MAGLRQPWLGITATAAMIAIACLAIVPWSYAALGGVVADAVMCSIPFTVVVGSFWHGREPRLIARGGHGRPVVSRDG